IDQTKKFIESGVQILNPGTSMTSYDKITAANLEYFDLCMENFINEFPDAYIILGVNTLFQKSLHQSLYEKYPKEMNVSPPAGKIGKMREGLNFSIASKVMRKRVCDNLKTLVIHIRNSSYADKIIGYFISYGECGDYWDFSEPIRENFQNWLKKKYNNNVSLLREKWHDNMVTFDTITLPRWQDLWEGDLGIFLDPEKSQKKIDFLYFHHDISVNVFSSFAQSIKEASKNESLVGLWNGYLFSGWGPARLPAYIQTTKKLRFSRMLEDSNFDFFVSPYDYYERHAGGIFHSMMPLDSILLHNKLPLSEQDDRTCLTTMHPRHNKNYYDVGNNFGQAKTLTESVNIFKRNFAGIAAKPNSGFYYFKQGGPPAEDYNHPQFYKLFSKFRQIEDKLLGKNKSNSQIAVVYSQYSYLYQKFNNLYYDFVHHQTFNELTRTGAPYDVFLDTDLTNANFDFSKYKLYIFVNSFYLSDKQRKIIKDKIEANGNTVIWLYAPGFITNKNLSVKAASDITGINLEMRNVELHSMKCVVTDYSDKITRGLSTNMRFGTDYRALSPLFYCADKKAVVLGEILASTPDNGVYIFRKPGLCVKRFKNWTSIWSAVPNIPSSLLRNIAKYAGVHIYDDGDDQVFASEKLLSVHTRYSGERTIKLPKMSNLYDPFKKQYIAKGVRELKLFIPAQTTELWLIEECSGKSK
ncbi:MAG: beta-galactosidase, partial [Victivallaceae bacterium]|nr:beta-galactosidase [Victivallaceae bacterium]